MCLCVQSVDCKLQPNEKQTRIPLLALCSNIIDGCAEVGDHCSDDRQSNIHGGGRQVLARLSFFLLLSCRLFVEMMSSIFVMTICAAASLWISPSLLVPSNASNNTIRAHSNRQRRCGLFIINVPSQR
jgi:hypothetical protein